MLDNAIAAKERISYLTWYHGSKRLWCWRSLAEVEKIMAKVCQICGKRPQSGHNVSHANNKTKRRWYPNLQRVRALHNGTVRYIRICTRCLRSGRVLKPA